MSGGYGAMTVEASGDWMGVLAQHFAGVRGAHPNDRLLIVFDFDGTVIDQSHAVGQLLLAYDRVHDTDHFYGLQAAELDVHGGQLEPVLVDRGVPASEVRNVLGWCRTHRSQAGSPSGCDRARPGVVEMMRWFQLQPSTFVGLTTARPARLRHETLRTINRLGKDLRAEFDVGLLHMDAGLLRLDDGDAVARVVDATRQALSAFAASGYRTFAVVDSDPAVLDGLARADHRGEVLMVHLGNPRVPGPAAFHAVQGPSFDLTALIREDDLPEQVTLVWHGVNDAHNLHQFLASKVHWAECDVRHDPRGRLVLRHDSFEATPWTRDERLLPLATAVHACASHGRGIKLDLKDGPAILPEVEALLAEHQVVDRQLWFNAGVDVLGADGFRTVRGTHPDAIVQCPVDFLGPLTLAAPEQARAVLGMLESWGIDRFSVGWGGDHTAPLLERLREWGHPVNLYGVPDLDAFLRAVLLLPRSLTADFNFPGWNHHGRGSGERRRERLGGGSHANPSSGGRPELAHQSRYAARAVVASE